MARWHIDGTANQVAHSVYNNLICIGKLAPPKVHAACLSTMCNRWVTHRRFQRRGCALNVCVLGCGVNNPHRNPEDSLEHYFHCEHITKAWAKICSDANASNQKAILLSYGKRSEVENIQFSALTYACYKLFNFYKHNNHPPTAEDCAHFIRQFLRELCNNNNKFGNTIRKMFNPHHH